MPWRLLLSPPLAGPANMAIDHELMHRARRTNESVLRVYGWQAPWLSLGRHQRAAGMYDNSEMARRHIGVVRRPTGGRALLHHREITYSVTCPIDGSESLGRAYARINGLLLHALATLGVHATIAPRSRPPLSPSVVPCFAEPSAGEIVAGGQKLVGSAQWRDAGVLLQHGSILVDDDQALVPMLLSEEEGSAIPPPATLAGLLARRPLAAELFVALEAAVRTLEDPDAQTLSHDTVSNETPTALVEHYTDEKWTWRR